MRFSEAMRLLEDGKKVRKTSWDKGEYIYIEDYQIKARDDEEWNCIIDGEWEEYIEGKDINVATKIEELWYMGRNEFVNDDNVPDYDKVCNKLNEVINKVNAQTEVLLAQEKEIKEIKEQLNY